jgi:hypothetical protein
MLESLKKARLVSYIESNLSQPALLEPWQLSSLSALKNEHQVVAFITPMFARLLDNTGIQVINSEEYAWLETVSKTKKYNQKPDNIFCHIGICNKKPPFRTDDPTLICLRQDSSFYGSLADWGLRDSIDVIGEAKVKIDNASLGEIVNYLQHLHYGNNSPDYSKFLLYDKNEFWMIRGARGIISSVQICRWGTVGAQQVLKKFIQEGRSPWITLLTAAADKWNLDVDSDSFLGKGAFGRFSK